MLAPLDCVQVNTLLNQLPQRTQFSQEVHASLHGLQDVVDLAVGREPADTKPDTAVGTLIACTQSPEHVTRLQRRRGTRTTRRQGNVLQGHQKGLALNVRERNVHAARVVVVGVSVEVGVLHRQETF